MDGKLPAKEPTAAGQAGALFIVGTPIGNLEDMTLRGLRLLGSVDAILAEDTRHTRKLLSHFDLHTPLVSFYQEAEKRKIPEMISQLQAGRRLALVSDAGMPGVSDPGALLVRAARDAGIRVEVVPGASAVLTALVGSGLDTDCFSFFGFLDAKPKTRFRFLETLKHRRETMVFFLPPHKLSQILKDFHEAWGDREAVLCREMTKLHEEFIRGKLSELLDNAAADPRGEYTLVIQGNDCFEEPLVSESIQEQLDRLQAEGLSLNQAIARVARRKGIPRSEIYALAHAIPKKSN